MRPVMIFKQLLPLRSQKWSRSELSIGIGLAGHKEAKIMGFFFSWPKFYIQNGNPNDSK
jgi:hypothetical protein